MPLDDDQKFLTRLLTDQNLLEAFLGDPEAAAIQSGFSIESARRLAKIPPEQLLDSGRSLIQKRLGMVVKILSQTHNALGHEPFGKLFRAYSVTLWPEGSKRHRLDAIAFGTFLQGRDLPDWIVDLACWETSVVEFEGSTATLLIRKLRHHPRSLISAIADGQAPPRKPTLLVGLRFPKNRPVRWLAVPLSLGKSL